MPQPFHRPERRFPNAPRLILPCLMINCPHCGKRLHSRRRWHGRKYVQTLNGPLFVAGGSKKCVNPECSHGGEHYFASQIVMISLPGSTYGLDVLAHIGWRHEQDHKQLVEIHQELTGLGILVNQPNVGRLYRQFLALLGTPSGRILRRLAETVERHGGVVLAIDALQPGGSGRMLYVLYEALEGSVIGAIQLDHPSSGELCQWLQAYQDLPYPILETLSDGEEAIVDALKTIWPGAPHQRCESHFLGNLAEKVLVYDDQLRKQLRDDLGGLPKVAENQAEMRVEADSTPPVDKTADANSTPPTQPNAKQPDETSFFCPPPQSGAIRS